MKTLEKIKDLRVKINKNKGRMKENKEIKQRNKTETVSNRIEGK